MQVKVIDSIVGCDLHRALAILHSKLGFTPEVSIRQWDWKAEAKRTQQEKDFDSTRIVLWMLNGWVHKPAKFTAVKKAKIEEEYFEEE